MHYNFVGRKILLKEVRIRSNKRQMLATSISFIFRYEENRSQNPYFIPNVHPVCREFIKQLLMRCV